MTIEKSTQGTAKKAGRPSNKTKVKQEGFVAETKSMEETLVSALETVVEKLTTKEEVAKVEVNKKERGIGDINSNEQFVVKSLRNNLVIYKDSRSGNIYRWHEYGDELMMNWADILNMRNSAKVFIDDMIISFEDEEVIKALRLEKMYEEVFATYDNNMIMDKHVHELRTIIPKLPKSIKMSLLDHARNVAKEEIESGNFKLLESTSRMRLIKEVLGLDLQLLLNDE